MSASVASLRTASSYSKMEPSNLQVDYDVNMTKLYRAICNCDWDEAIKAIDENPQEARTWVVRYYEQEDTTTSEEHRDIMWRFLPIHSACARDPPAALMSALLKAYPGGAHQVDDQGMYALHYACGNQASREVIRLLLVANSRAAKSADPRGMLPIHYLACWGPSSVSIIDMVLVANRDVGNCKDDDGNTPLDLAMEGDYPERDAVVVALKRWLERKSIPPPSSSSGGATPPRVMRKQVAAPPPQEDESPKTSEGGSSDHSPPVVAVASTESSEVEIVNIDDDDDDEGPLGSVENNNHNVKSIPSSPSSHTLSRLQKEVIKLRSELAQSDTNMEEKNSTVSSLTTKCNELQDQVDQLTAALEESKNQVTELETEKDEIKTNLESSEFQLSEALEQNEQLRDELAQLQQEYEAKDKWATNLNNRLGSLAATVESLKAEQDRMVHVAHERDAQLMEASQTRQENLRMLIDMEQEFMETVMGGGEEPVFEKQAKELDALAAVITAMRM